MNIEEHSTQEQKSIATKGSNWDGLDLILYDIIHTEVMCNNGTLTSACEKASKQLNKTVGACMNRYSSHIKNIIRNEELVSKIEGNRGRGNLKVIESKKNDLSLERPALSLMNCISMLSSKKSLTFQSTLKNWKASSLPYSIQKTICLNQNL